MKTEAQPFKTYGTQQEQSQEGSSWQYKLSSGNKSHNQTLNLQVKKLEKEEQTHSF